MDAHHLTVNLLLNRLLGSDLHRPVRHNHGEFVVCQVCVLLLCDRNRIIPVGFDDPDLLKDRVLKPVVHDRDAWVLLHKHPVRVLACLFCQRLIAWAYRLKYTNLIGRCEQTHKRREHPVYRFCNLTGNNLRATLDLVTVGVTHVGRKRILALLDRLGLQETYGVVDFALQYCFESTVVHYTTQLTLGFRGFDQDVVSDIPIAKYRNASEA